MQFLYAFIALFGFWILLSGQFDAFHLALGLVSSGLIAAWTGHLFPRFSLGTIFKLNQYGIWLLKEIIMANLHVLYVALHPNMKKFINPQITTYKSKLKSDFAKFIMANSITLTPGTVTIWIDEKNQFMVHALTDQTKEGVPGEMEKRVAEVFGEAS